MSRRDSTSSCGCCEIPGFPGYFATSDGRILSTRLGGDPKELAGHRLDNGHINISLCVDGKPVIKLAHHLVMLAFRVDRPPRLMCRHLNGIPWDNRIENLAWGTRQEILADSRARRARGISIDPVERRVRDRIPGPDSIAEIEIRPVPGFDGYFAGSDGSVWSNKATGKRKAMKNVLFKMLQHTDDEGYKRIGLAINGRARRLGVHVIVCLAFNGLPSSKGMMCRHLDDNKENNIPTNLAWGTQKDNSVDMVRNGRSMRGEKHPLAKLKESDVFEIRELAERGIGRKEISSLKNISLSTISAIKTGKIWSHAKQNRD